MKKKYITLQEHQEILYELLYTLDDFCKEHNIRYFLAHGTLLGAIRHHGIIPWDDDADVMMEREEYERFEKLITQNPPKGYKAYSINNTKHYYFPFIKFGKLGTKVIETDWKCVPKEGIGINIDVFPIDGCPNNIEESKEYVVNVTNTFIDSIRFWCNRDRKSYSDLKGKLYYYIFIWLRKQPFILKPHLKNIFSQAKKYSLKNSKFFFSFWTFYGCRNLFPKYAIDEIIKCKFGDRELPIPKGYDFMLKKEYGNYMVPPTEKGKESTHKHVEIYVEKD